MGRIDDSKREYKQWCAGMGITSASDINRLADEGKIGELISVCEARHERVLSETAREIRDRGEKIVFIAGPSSSGKTTTAARLRLNLERLGISAVSVSLDDYYLNREDMPKNADGEPDFEALEAIDYRRCSEDLAELAAGREAILPRYDFMSKREIADARRLRLPENGLIIVEGIHGLNPKLGDNIPDGEKYRLYCSALSGLDDAEGKRIPSRVCRMTRRLVRDYYFRGADCKTTLDLWPNQESSAQRNIYPYTDTADEIFNTSLLYEFCVYRSHMLKVMEESDCGCYAEETEYLTRIARGFRQISEDDVPGISIVREFIGGGTLW